MTASPAVGAAAAGVGGMGGGGRARHAPDQKAGSPGHRGDVVTTVKSGIQEHGCRLVVNSTSKSRLAGVAAAMSTFYRFSYCTVNWLLIYSEGKVLRMAQHFNNSGV